MNPSGPNQPPIGYNLPPGGVSGHGVRMMPSPGPKFYTSPASVPGSMNHIQPMANAPASAPGRPIHQTGVSNMVVNPMPPAPSVGGMMPIKRSGQGNVPIGPASGRSQPLKKKRKIGDKVIPAQVCELVPESQAYMDLLAFERKLDATITRKRLEIQEALKRPMKIRRKLRIYVSHTFYPGKEPENENEEGQIAQWELRVEGRLMDETGACPTTNQSSPASQQKSESSKTAKRKFSSFFKSLVIELDKDIYGPDNHLVEWHRTPSTNETDGFQVKRPGDRSVKCTILLLLDYQPMKFKLDPRLARILGTHTETRPKIIEALWQYVKTHKLQDANERDHINCDKYLEQIFQCQRMRFMEVPQRLNALLHPPDPIVINHIITCNVEGSEPKKTACYDIDVEIDDPIKMQMSQFLSVQQNQNEIGLNNAKIFETVEQIQQFKTQREFFLGFSQNPQDFIQKWLISQCRDLKLMTDVNGQPETERQADYFTQPWMHEAVGRYFYSKVQQKRAELEQALGIRNM